jgi:hypothetical protein
MSNHLIQPIDIDGTLYCVNNGWITPNWRTIDFLNGDLTGPFGDAWILIGEGGFYESGSGSVKFATCCIWKATVVAQNPRMGTGTTFTIRVEINDVLIQEETLTGDGTIEIVVDLNDLGLMGRACGNLWVIYAEADYVDDFNGQIDVAIEDVTFGPPV